MGADVEQPAASGLKPVQRDAQEALGYLAAEFRILGAFGPDGRAVELERLQRLSRDRTEAPPERRKQPGQADHIAAPELFDDHPPAPGNDGVQLDLAG